MTALIIILSIFAFIFLLTLIPLKVKLVFSEEFALTIRYLFLRFKIFPSKEEPIEEKADSSAEEQKPEGMGGRFHSGGVRRLW